MKDYLRWGILGTAQITRVGVGPAIAAADGHELAAIASRDPERGRAFARELDIARVHDTYQALLDDADLDAVYIPVPNALHAEWTIKALDAGKHVLCEKPLATTESDARAVLVRAQASDKIVMEGFMYRFHPRLARAQEILDRHELGEIRGIKAFYTFQLDKAGDVRAGAFESDIRLRPDLGGGALFDVGSYCVNGLRWYFRNEPIWVSSWAHQPNPSGVETRAAGILDFGGGRIGEFFCAMDTYGGGHVEILGRDAKLTIPVAFRLRPSADPLPLIIERGGSTTVEEFPYADQYRAEIEAFGAAARGEIEPPIPLTDSVANLRALDALRRSWSNGPQHLGNQPQAWSHRT